MRGWIGAAAAAALVAVPIGEAAAQSAPHVPPAEAPGTDAPGEQETVSASLLTRVPDPASVTMPALAFTPTPEIESTYDKYFYFHRAGTSFQTALANLRECDGFARGLSMGMTYQAGPAPYTVTGAAGAAIGNLLAFAIFGSALKRKVRRQNMRRCMHYKGYERYGLEKALWQTFNFEEGLSGVDEVDRQRMLAQQALVAATAEVPARGLGI